MRKARSTVETYLDADQANGPDQRWPVRMARSQVSYIKGDL